MSINTTNERAVVVGASSGIGRAAALRLAKDGYSILAIGRNREKLNSLRTDAASQRCADRLTISAADASDEAAIRAALRAFDRFHHIVLTPSTALGMGAFSDLGSAELRAAFDGKYWTHVTALQQAIPFLEPGGSVTFISAASSGAAYAGTAGLAAINAAIEAMVPVLAVELAPTRVNAISPGVIDTPWWDALPVESRNGLFAHVAQSAPAGRVGSADDIADAIAFVVGNTYTTANVLVVDGGARLRIG